MIVLDYSDKRPIYEQIVDRMRTLIAGGILEPDEKLPSVRSLAVDLSINPNTIQRAYSQLEREGFIYSVRGRGNFVRADGNSLRLQQDKLLGTVKKQLIACRDQQVEYERVLGCLNEVYDKLNGYHEDDGGLSEYERVNAKLSEHERVNAKLSEYERVNAKLSEHERVNAKLSEHEGFNARLSGYDEGVEI